MFFKNLCKCFNFFLSVYTPSRVVWTVDKHCGCLFIESSFYGFYIKTEVSFRAYFNKVSAMIAYIVLVFSKIWSRHNNIVTVVKNSLKQSIKSPCSTYCHDYTVTSYLDTLLLACFFGHCITAELKTSVWHISMKILFTTCCDLFFQRSFYILWRFKIRISDAEIKNLVIAILRFEFDTFLKHLADNTRSLACHCFFYKC